MYEGKTVGVVVPCYNEADFVGDVIDAIPSFVDRAYVIDDASADDTWAVIQRSARRANEAQTPAVADGGSQFDRRIVAICHDENRGAGGAIKTGYRHALEDGLDVTAVIDGDGQMDPGILDRMIEPVVSGRADYAKGDRLRRADNWGAMSRFRLFGNVLLSFLTKVASGYWGMMDPQNGYTAISGRALEALDIDALYDDYGFLNDVLVRLNASGMRVADVPMRARYGDEKSGIRYTRFVPSLSGLLLRRFCWRLGSRYLVGDFHPLVFLYVVGLVSVMGGTGLVVGGLLTGATYGTPAIVLWVFGALSTALAMTFDRNANAHLEVGEPNRLGGDSR